MIFLFLILASNAHAFETTEVDYRLNDKHIVHTIDAKALKIVSGKNTLKRQLASDDLKWIEEKIEVLKSHSRPECGEESALTIKQKGREPFTVCGDQKDARDFLSVIAIK